MESSTNSSIHTLPENHINGIVGKLNDINDISDEIATYSRGIDNLTEELQRTTLDDIGIQRSSIEPMYTETNGLCTDTTASPATFELNGSVRTNGVELINGEHNYAINDNENRNDLNGDGNADVCNGNCDVVDSSHSTIFSELVNNSSNSILVSDCHVYQSANDSFSSMAANSNGISDDVLLRSVDLRSKFHFLDYFVLNFNFSRSTNDG